MFSLLFNYSYTYRVKIHWIVSTELHTLKALLNCMLIAFCITLEKSKITKILNSEENSNRKTSDQMAISIAQTSSLKFIE